VLVGRTWDLESGDCVCRILLSNWWLGDRAPRLIAPSARVISSQGSGLYIIAGELPDTTGGHGFLAGDQIQITTPDGRFSDWNPPGGLIILDGTDKSEVRIVVPGADPFDENIDGRNVELAPATAHANTLRP